MEYDKQNIDNLKRLTRIKIKQAAEKVREVTFAELEAFVAANGLNEGLQYKVTDLGYNVLATGINSYIIIGAIPYKKWIGCLINDINGFSFIEFENTFNETIIWDNQIIDEQPSAGVYKASKNTPFNISRIFFPNIFLILDYANMFDGQFGNVYTDNTDIYFNVVDSLGQNTDSWGVSKVYIEIREYY